MAPVVEFTLSNPILRETRKALPDVRMEVQDERISAGGTPELVMLVTGSNTDLEAFEQRLPSDPSIEEYDSLSDFGEGRLIQITLSEAGFTGMTYPVAVNFDITFLNVEARGERMRYRAQVPSLEALSHYREHCSDRSLNFELTNIYQKRSLNERRYGLTSRQREVLRQALEDGYFEVPRQTSLEELAAEFEVSNQAISALLRRGQSRLLRHTIGTDQ
ncbi:bacterio-opsin activator [Natronococcus pandeyae]|uniref:Bacterio-opsin activator n=2 Tax=Natronococcus pandeyae TaxID=2055836 RepID=A0A8J8Q276_9EURY|nr:bacterio-opsin activator [Natronococcus pandeyae]